MLLECDLYKSHRYDHHDKHMNEEHLSQDDSLSLLATMHH